MSSVTSFEDRSPLRTASPSKRSVRVPSPSVYPTANVESLGGSGDRRATDRRIMTADRAVRTSIQESDAPAATDVYLPLPGGGGGGEATTPEEAQALQQACVPPDRCEERPPVPSLRIGAKAAIGRREHQCNPSLLIHCGGTRLPAPELLGDALGWSHTPRVEPAAVGLPAYEGWPRPGPTPAWCLHLFALCHLHVKDAIALNAQIGAPTASDARSLGARDLEPVVQALRQLQRDGHLPTDPSTRLHFSCDELQAYLGSEDGQGRAARTRPQWAKLLETPTLLVVALRRGRRVAQLGPRSPDYLSGEAVYASLADLRSRRLAEMAAHVDGRNRELDPELLNRTQRRRCRYNEDMRLKDKTQHARMVHAHHARRRDAARRANLANRNFDERRYEASRDAYAAAIQQAEHLETLVAAADDKARGELMRKLSEATRRAEQSAAHVAFASAKAEASLKRYKAPPPIGPTDKIPIELDPFMHDLVAVDQPYSYHGDMLEARSSTASQTYRDAGAPRSAASINHELSQAEHILHSLQKEPEALPRPGGPEPLDDAGSYTRPYKGPIVKEDWARMTYGNDTPAEKSQVGPRHPLNRMPPFAHGALDAKEQRTYFAPRPHLRKRAGYWPGLGTPHKTLS